MTAEHAGLRASAVSHSFGAVRALEAVSFDVAPGEIHSLCGENGAGKSTLLRILGGELTPDSGSATIDGRAVPRTVRGAEAIGVAVIHQDPIAFPDLTAAETIFVGREPRRLAGLWLDRSHMRKRARELLSSLGESIDLSRPASQLSLAQRQMVAIARALAIECRFLVLDEPTASLSAREVSSLHTLVRRLAAKGVGILFVSHRLDEVLALSNRVTVLRDGNWVATESAAALSRERLVALMVGRHVPERTQTAISGPRGSQRLEVRDLSRAPAFGPVSLSVHAGEIVGLAGLVGSGRSELARAIAGIDHADGGSILLDGRPLPRATVRVAADSGLVLVPEDRRDQGLVPELSIATNIAMSDSPGLSRVGFINTRAVHSLAEQSRGRLRIRCHSVNSAVSTLSGGNQQKVLLAKWLARNPKVLILDEPTRGVDIGAKDEIHNLVRELANAGAAVLLISSELTEVLALADRILVMREGLIAGEFAAGASQEAVLAAAMPQQPGPHTGSAA